MADKSSLTDEQYLNLFKISEYKYLIGIFQDGITVHKQQIRALNIFHALYNTFLKDKVGDPDYIIGVIGGGIAGLTFAAAALKAGLRVDLFEQQPVYLHMQYGCDTRKIHPNLYEWPDRGYANPYAEMPVLDWKHDSASNIAKQIIHEWNKVKTETVASHPHGKKNLFEFKDNEIDSITEFNVKGRDRLKITHHTDEIRGSRMCDLLILATGYGVEKGVRSRAKTPSYWRNDSYSQTDLYQKQNKYIISGIGDGGLIDMFRLKIFDFSYELIIDIIENHENGPGLLQELIDLKKQVEADLGTDGGLLHDRFSQLKNDYEYIYKELSDRGLLRPNVVWLNDIYDNFEASLDYKKMSFMHAFLTFILVRHGIKSGVDYKPGDLVYDNSLKTYTIDSIPVLDSTSVIIRHGTERMSSVPKKYFFKTDKTLELIREEQQKVYNYGRVQKRWSNNELTSLFNPRELRRFEYLNPSTSVLCTNFVAALARQFAEYYKGKKDFKIVLYRLLYINGAYFYQQMTAFFGSKTQTINSGVGQVFEVSKGIVGFTFQYARPLLVINRGNQDFEKLIGHLGLNTIREKASENKAFLTVPIMGLAGIEKVAGCNAVLFIDAADKDFFGDDQKLVQQNILDMITPAVAGFIDAIEHYLNNKMIRMVQLDFPPPVIEKEPPQWFKDNSCIRDLSATVRGLAPEVSGLKFDDFYTFTII